MAALGHTVPPESGQAVQEQLGGPAQSRQSSSVALTNEVEPVKGKNDVLDQPRIKDTSDTLFGTKLEKSRSFTTSVSICSLDLFANVTNVDLLDSFIKFLSCYWISWTKKFPQRFNIRVKNSTIH